MIKSNEVFQGRQTIVEGGFQVHCVFNINMCNAQLLGTDRP